MRPTLKKLPAWGIGLPRPKFSRVGFVFPCWFGTGLSLVISLLVFASEFFPRSTLTTTRRLSISLRRKWKTNRRNAHLFPASEREGLSWD